MISVHGYAGDVGQIKMMLPYYLHHRCPVCILSPEDSPITREMLPLRRELGFRHAGKRAYVGQLSLDRQIEHLKVLLQHPKEYNWFLMNDSDSVVLSAKLPAYLFSEPETVWSNVVSDAMHDAHRPPDYPWPHLAFQPPYFMSRRAIERMLTVADSVKADPHTPFIDWCMMAWSVKAGLVYRSYPEGASAPTNIGSEAMRMMTELVDRHGRFFIHSVKSAESLKVLAWARIAYLKRHKLTP